jgi:hypothetical protein
MFNNNVIANGFTSNINIGNNFQLNNILVSVVGYDFSLSTFVYTNYTKNIFIANLGSLYLEYFDEVGIQYLYVTPINS